MTTTTDTPTIPTVADALPATSTTRPWDAPRLTSSPRLTARRAGWVLATVVGGAAVTAAIAMGTRAPEVSAPAETSSSVTDAAESAHGTAAGISTGAGAAVSPATVVVALTAGDAVALAHGQAGSVTTAGGSRAVATAASAGSTPMSSASELVHGTRGGISDAAGDVVAR
jgi:hypothetical protein